MVGKLVLYAQSTTKDYIRAEGNFHEENIVERTNKAKIRPEEQSEKVENCREKFSNEIQLKRPHRQKQAQEQNKKEWASSVGLCQRHKP